MDSEARIVDCIRAAIDDVGLPERTHAEMSNIIGLGLKEALTTLYPAEPTAHHEALVERYRHHWLFENATPAEMFAGAEDMLVSLRERGYYLAIATGKARRGLKRVLDETGLGDLFDSSRCADETQSKPHPQMLEQIMDEIGVPGMRTLMIGDTEYDLRMARDAGAHALGVSYGVHEKARLLACEPIGCVDSIADLHDWLLDGTPRAVRNGGIT
ncbi:MAG: HAD-IA family hydrolase [Pseudomonadota bacterium]|nr:MAG: HAD-IA family hydrolase [Pseudomonadota bacterium]